MHKRLAQKADVSAVQVEMRKFISDTLNRMTWNFGLMTLVSTIVMVTAMFLIR
ncbi:hypothetical protein FBY10_10232 [Pseudomonas sp. SJZ103]|jgi:hypothetical protein|uniref:Uncharacterized protein n=1 Tax=Pseudomonas salomonii TaxID=191391 RepID=A0A1H3V2K9_9PSED|nr:MULTISPECIES: hypothetical protein [Pseudomonas]MBB6288903.1 hypothetical protein [Pseudomonas sp. SJZ073]MBB6313875.1 hypothetical protein [Pseudomonas sp. JAI120]MBD8237884.1 hypothetical protein [Pseudomonas fluorescens]MBI6611505.1 hypothetical protein [Pseudomonas simiae]MBJ2242749.1 hypothetical protein [Pseudomonas sp. MF6768]